MFFSGIKWRFNLVVGHVQGAHIYELLEITYLISLENIVFDDCHLSF